MTTPKSAATEAEGSGAEIAWLIEETWSGHVHYIHRDFDAARWRAECKSLDAAPYVWIPSGTGGVTLTWRRAEVPFIVKDDAAAMRFATKADADAWIAAQPRWLSHSDQFQAREHMWPANTHSAKLTAPDGEGRS